MLDVVGLLDVEKWRPARTQLLALMKRVKALPLPCNAKLRAVRTTLLVHVFPTFVEATYAGERGDLVKASHLEDTGVVWLNHATMLLDG